jgi:hypothetical protein
MAKENNAIVLLKFVKVKGLLQSKEVDGLAHFEDVGKKFGEAATLCGIQTNHLNHTKALVNCKPCLHAALDLIMAGNFTYQEELLEATGINSNKGQLVIAVGLDRKVFVTGDYNGSPTRLKKGFDPNKIMNDIEWHIKNTSAGGRIEKVQDVSGVYLVTLEETFVPTKRRFFKEGHPVCFHCGGEGCTGEC